MPDQPSSNGPSEKNLDPEEVLHAAARFGDAPLDIAEVALAFAALDRPGVLTDRYRQELQAMSDAVTDRLAAVVDDSSAEQRAACVSQVLGENLSFKGDSATYDDPRNANLMHVIDRRKGLPVALGILYIHTARCQGWWVEGLNFPNHFLIRIRLDGSQVILDPFHQGRVMDAPALRGLIRDMSNGKTELTPAATQAVPDRQVLLRLQNNIKLRLYQSAGFTRALAVLERMRILAPDLIDLQREAGMVNARIGNLGAAITLLRGYLEYPEASAASRHETARVLRDLEKRLN
ncbi:MAG: transglutaminase-like domain-containing protein [Alphaproteobacteria bacterium]|nr:transglutaminase-like domain-containing protein [Alphaproteobacteria bacterium]